jgi:hypothetical protein
MGLSVRGVVALGEDPTPIAPRSRRSQPCVRLRLLGKTASRRDPSTVERAEGYYREALALAGELGMRPLVAHCHLHLSRLSLKTGQGEARASDDRDDDISRDGHSILAGPRGGDAGRTFATMPRTAFLKQGAKPSRRHQAAGGTVAPGQGGE